MASEASPARASGTAKQIKRRVRMVILSGSLLLLLFPYVVLRLFSLTSADVRPFCGKVESGIPTNHVM
jgi:hypothetical protein